MKNISLGLLLALSLVVVSMGTGQAQMSVKRLASGLTRPVGLEVAPNDNDRLFILEQSGTIRILTTENVLLPAPFLDISAKVSDLYGAFGSIERGLLGLAFHPKYQVNGRFFVYYMAHGDSTTVLEEYSVSGNPDIADPFSGVQLMTFDQPTTFHNAGQIAFGKDDYLYVGLGEGGVCENAQDTNLLLGKILRIDVDTGSPYSVPSTNPFFGLAGYRDEIWAYGLRNPWRFTFDSLTGDMFIADVGPLNFEEINFQPASSSGGESYGWAHMEASQCNNFQNCPEGVTIPGDCTNGGSHVMPILQYTHQANPPRCAIIGGHVYRGSEMPTLDGHYFYADFCSGEVRSLKYDGNEITFLHNWTHRFTPDQGTIDRISAWGQDNSGELYLVDWGNTGMTAGEIFKMIREGTGTDTPAIEGAVDRLLQSHPNPFNPQVSLRFQLAREGYADLDVLDARGRVLRRFHEDALPPGEHRIRWDGKDDGGSPLGSGVYLLRLRTAGGEDTGKVVLAR